MKQWRYDADALKSNIGYRQDRDLFFLVTQYLTPPFMAETSNTAIPALAMKHTFKQHKLDQEEIII
jgi:hypothetical protein